MSSCLGECALLTQSQIRGWDGVRGIRELWMVRWAGWCYRVFWHLCRLLQCWCASGHLCYSFLFPLYPAVILHFPLASEGRACPCFFLPCMCRPSTGWFHPPFVRKEAPFPSFPSLSSSSFLLPHPLSLTCSYLPLLLQQMWMAVSLGFPLCPPAKWQWRTSRQTPLPSLSEKHKWLRASSETGVRSSESPFSVLPKTSAFRVGLGKAYFIP